MSARMPLTRRVTRMYREASTRSRMLGERWYADAYETAHELAAESGHSVEVAVGVIAATSPRMGWGPNVRLARRILRTGDTSHGYLSDGLRKAARILAGEDPLRVLTSDKVANFYRAIISRGRDGIVIDRHAYDLAVGIRHEGERPSLTAKQYRDVAHVYRRAADILSRELEHPISASEVQATVWLEWRNRFWAPGAFDNTSEA